MMENRIVEPIHYYLCIFNVTLQQILSGIRYEFFSESYLTIERIEFHLLRERFVVRSGPGWQRVWIVVRSVGGMQA